MTEKLSTYDHADISVGLGTLQKICYRVSKDHGFHDYSEVPFNVGEKLALIHSEVSEALEAVRGKPEDNNLVEELADIIIRVADLAGYMGLDLAGATTRKIEKNMGRPYKHGKNF